jgi:hypothetical protein
MSVEKKNLSPKAQKTWNLLTEHEKAVIQRDYPMRADRDDLIRALRVKKVSFPVLMELSGLTKSPLYRIVSKQRKEKSISDESLRALQPYEGLIKALYEIIKSNSK